MPQSKDEVRSEGVEPCEVKASSTVLNGEDEETGRKALRLVLTQRRHDLLLVLLHLTWCTAPICLTPNQSPPGARHVSVGAASTTAYLAPRVVGAEVCDG
jgi:hypothetical protein